MLQRDLFQYLLDALDILPKKTLQIAGEYLDAQTHALSTLLAEFSVMINPREANNILLERGLLAEAERLSSRGVVKRYKVLTEAGLAYGRNECYSLAPNQTQPRYYKETFDELAELLSGGAQSQNPLMSITL